MNSAPSTSARPKPGLASQVLRHALALVLALILAAGAWEMILRAWVIESTPLRQEAGLGLMPEPRSFFFSNLENRQWGRYNEHGFHDGPITPRKPGELRVLMLGDSFVEALQVEAGQTSAALLERHLNEALRQHQLGSQPWKSVRVFNGGRSGTGIGYVVALADQYKALFDPDLVIVVVRENWERNFDRTWEVTLSEQNGSIRPLIKWRRESSGGLKQRLIDAGGRQLVLSTYGSRQLKAMLASPSAPQSPAAPVAAKDGKAVDAPRPDVPGAGEKNDQRAASPGKPPPAAPAPANEQLLLKVADWAAPSLKQAYPRLLVVHLPGEPRAGEAKGEALVSPGDVTATERRFELGCRELKIPLLDMRPEIESDFARTRIPPNGFANSMPWYGHFNAHGHSLLARSMARAIASQPELLAPAR